MKKKYLFLRTDRIGDFIFSSILIRAIKDNDKNSHVTVISSKKNYEYINGQKYIDNVILYPKNFISKLFLIRKLRKQKIYFIAALDGKKRSIYICLLVKAKYKFLVSTKKLYAKILKKKFTKIIIDFNNRPKINEILNILNSLNYKFKNKYINFTNKENYIKKDVVNLIKMIKKNYITFHLDEKWIGGQYIDKYTNIEPNNYELLEFLKKLIKNTNKNILITTGNRENNLILFMKKNFSSISSRFYIKKFSNKLIVIADKITFFELEYFIKYSSKLISCHGSPTHLASSMNKKIIDIFDQEHNLFYRKWNHHFKNYKFLYRKKFSELSKNILKIV